MNQYSSKTDAAPRSLVEAMAWRAHLTESDTDTSEAFEAWLAADARNSAAWKQVQRSWDLFGEHASAPELVEVRRAALADARNASRNRGFRPALRTLRSRIAIAASVLILVVGGLVVWQSTQPDIYRTNPGERRVITLVDGSQIALDSQSEVRVLYSKNARNLTLLRGQARFDVAHDVERPFSVAVGTQKVVATGTSFNVDLLGANLLVTLIEGHVVVLPQAPNPVEPSRGGNPESGVESSRDPLPRETARTQRLVEERTAADGTEGIGDGTWGEGRRQAKRGIELVAGEQLVMSPSSPPSIEHINVERATAWQNGQLVFENEPLSSVIARVNRYAQRPIVLADAEASALRISGVFRAGDVDAFVSTITHYLPVRADRDNDGSIRLRSR